MHLFQRNSKLGFPVIVDPLTENFQNLCSMIAADREDERGSRIFFYSFCFKVWKASNSAGVQIAKIGTHLLHAEDSDVSLSATASLPARSG